MSRNNASVPTSFLARPRGVGIVVVLSVLTVLALLAALMAVTVQVELTSANVTSHRVKADHLVNSCVEHVRAVLASASFASPGDPLRQWTMLDRQFGEDKAGQPVWFNVRDSSGVLVGRYRVRIVDEAGKANLNAACLTSPSQGQGWNPSEINLAQALGMQPLSAARIMTHRYGDDGKPGMANVDDDRNNAVLMADRIDNNANGLVDEDDEGVDDPGEYSMHRLYGDDRMFTGINEAMGLIDLHGGTGETDRHAARRAFIGSATVYSEDLPGSPTLPNDVPADLNCMTARECRRRIDVANMAEPFEPVAINRTKLALNMCDYRDENHVLSTLGSIYGVEAVCFNEVLANDLGCTFHLVASSFPVKCYGDPGIGEELGELYGVMEPPDCPPGVNEKKKRPMFITSFPYFTCRDYYCQSFAPHHMWHVKPSADIGSFYAGGSLRFTLPDVPGESGKNNPDIWSWGDHGNAKSMPGMTVRDGSEGRGGGDVGYNLLYKEMMKVLKERGKASGNHPKFPDNFFVGAYAAIYPWNNPGAPIGNYEVTSSRDHTFTARGVDAYTGAFFPSNSNFDLSISFEGWGEGNTALTPGVNTQHMFFPRKKSPNRYFKVQLVRDPVGDPKFKGWKVHTLGVSGEAGSDEYRTETALVWDYRDGEPVRTDGAGWLDVTMKSSKDIKYRSLTGQVISYARLISPEVVEMYNASATPVSLANWRVICNTGSLATEIGRIRRTTYYDRTINRPVIDDNPCVPAGGYFYLVNDTKLFDARYGNADSSWGSTPDENTPVFQMDQQRWGISYKIAKLRPYWAGCRLFVKNERWDKDMFRFESVQFLYPDKTRNEKSWHGYIVPLLSGNDENSFNFGIDHSFSLPDVDGEVMILGLPYKGGIVSLTLKDQYEQVCARTVDYGTLKTEEIEYSAEKSDPTQYEWIKQKTTSIGGTERRAKNRALSNRAAKPASIKNASYCSVGELRRVSTAGDFETVGDSGNKSRRIGSMIMLANTFCASAIRLEAAGDAVVRSGWQEAAGTVDGASISAVRANTHWEPDQWVGHMLRFTSGTLRNQTFPVFANTPSTVYLSMTNSTSAPLSAPSRLPLRPLKGDTFSLGPGYITTFAFSRKSNQQGEWLWKQRVPVRDRYHLYLYGLSDAIASTEFLEENNNAPLDVDVWNWDTGVYDTLCRRERYRKEDCISAGAIKAAHISKNGDFKLRITPHDVETIKLRDTLGKSVSANRHTGFAWFNYAMLSPMPVTGRVNINSAPPQVLAALPGMKQNVAANIAAGIDARGVPQLKPYRGPGDLLKVKGMDFDIFERIANLVCISSDAFTIDAEVQVLSDTAANGVYDEQAGDTVLAQRRQKVVVVGEPGRTPPLFNVVEKY